MNELIMAEAINQEDVCTLKKLCFARSSECTVSCQFWCAAAQQVKDAKNFPCPVALGLDIVGNEKHGKCDMPMYRMLLKEGINCCKDGKCVFDYVLRNKIPPQDFTSYDGFPATYERQRLSLGEIEHILRNAGL